MREVAAQLGYTATALRARFPGLSAALAARLPERRLFERERMRAQLQSALDQNPAPFMKDVARSVGRDQGHLRVLFPSLCQQIRERYIEKNKRVATQKRLQFHAQIRAAVTDLCERGINPSRKHVFAAIVGPSMRCSHTLDEQIAQTLRELEAASRVRPRCLFVSAG